MILRGLKKMKMKVAQRKERRAAPPLGVSVQEANWCPSLFAMYNKMLRDEWKEEENHEDKDLIHTGVPPRGKDRFFLKAFLVAFLSFFPKTYIMSH